LKTHLASVRSCESGVNTGPAVLGEVQGDAGGVTVMGDTVNVAARLQAVAIPGTIFLTEATRKLVDGQIDSEFVGERQFKGKAEPLKLYKLTGLRRDTTRFAALVARGLSPFVGRKRELELLDRNLEASRQELRIVDIVAEPGMGKSRLLHEFRRGLKQHDILILSGNCSPDGKQTAFLPFIEVVRGSFGLSVGEAEGDVRRKLEAGLTRLQRNSPENLGLLLNLLGLPSPVGALDGLDGLLIGLRTRDLLLAMLETRSRLSPLALLIEDLHWIDSASEELLSNIVDLGAKAPALVPLTRRPEYRPPWFSHPGVATLELEPLEAGAVRRLVEARLGVSRLPASLARTIEERAEGNPLFAEEIVTFLGERGLLKVEADKVEFDSLRVPQALPSNVQNLLTARVDRLASDRRTLLQAASVIGRRFDPALVKAVTSEGDMQAALPELEGLDLVRRAAVGGNYEFKHALVRDALYESLLSARRAELHLRVAEEIERRSGNRLAEVAEELAHHYSQTDRRAKAFTYLAMAGEKSLGVYSLDEAERCFAAAIALAERQAECATDGQIVETLISYAALLNMRLQLIRSIDLLRRFSAGIERLGDDVRVVILRHHNVFALLWNTRYREALAVQREASLMADRLGETRARAYALTTRILSSTIAAPMSLAEFELTRDEALKAASATSDPYIRIWVRYVTAWEEFHRGRMAHSRRTALELIELGRETGDPRSLGEGVSILALIAVISDNYEEALEYSEQAIAIGITPLERDTGVNAKGSALVLLKRVEEGITVIEQFQRRAIADGNVYSLNLSNAVHAVSKAIRGDLAAAARTLSELIQLQDSLGYATAADWYRTLLCEMYLQVLEGKEKAPLPVLFKNLPFIAQTMLTGGKRIVCWINQVHQNPRFDPNGHYVGRCEMILGLLYKAKKKTGLAVLHLTEARRITAQWGPTPMLARIDAALAALSTAA
jgi:tetratricopeptide (TPR) repeat protein